MIGKGEGDCQFTGEGKGRAAFRSSWFIPMFGSERKVRGLGMYSAAARDAGRTGSVRPGWVGKGQGRSDHVGGQYQSCRPSGKSDIERWPLDGWTFADGIGSWSGKIFLFARLMVYTLPTP